MRKTVKISQLDQRIRLCHREDKERGDESLEDSNWLWEGLREFVYHKLLVWKVTWQIFSWDGNDITGSTQTYGEGRIEKQGCSNRRACYKTQIDTLRDYEWIKTDIADIETVAYSTFELLADQILTTLWFTWGQMKVTVSQYTDFRESSFRTVKTNNWDWIENKSDIKSTKSKRV